MLPATDVDQQLKKPIVCGDKAIVYFGFFINNRCYRKGFRYVDNSGYGEIVAASEVEAERWFMEFLVQEAFVNL